MSKETSHRYYLKNRDRMLSKAKKYREEHPQQVKEYHAEYNELNREKLSKNKLVDYHKNKVKYLKLRYENEYKIKLETLTHYGNGKLSCLQCSMSDPDMLTIDHIDNNGGEERKQLNHKAGAKFYCWLKKNGYPQGYQTLCANCQLKKEILRRRKLSEDISRFNKN
jgi:hypothetical protein